MPLHILHSIICLVKKQTNKQTKCDHQAPLMVDDIEKDVFLLKFSHFSSQG